MEATKTNNPIKGFIANIVDKNYKDANTFLQKMVEDKLKSRIKDSAFVKKTTNLDK
jgi:hypothetical protein